MKCKVFIKYINNPNPNGNFIVEVSKLNLNKLLFTLISFKNRRLKIILNVFKASDIKRYIKKQRIMCV